MNLNQVKNKLMDYEVIGVDEGQFVSYFYFNPPHGFR